MESSNKNDGCNFEDVEGDELEEGMELSEEMEIPEVPVSTESCVICPHYSYANDPINDEMINIKTQRGVENCNYW